MYPPHVAVYNTFFQSHICRRASVEVEIMKLTVRPDEHIPLCSTKAPAVFFISDLLHLLLFLFLLPFLLHPLLFLLRRLDVPPRERLNCRPPACTRPFECR